MVFAFLIDNGIAMRAFSVYTLQFKGNYSRLKMYVTSRCIY